MKKFIPAILLLITVMCFEVKAQNVINETITWNSVRAINQKDNSEIVYNCSFTTHGNKSIDWSQKEGSKVSSYTITSVNGTWGNISEDGLIVFGVTQGVVTGELTFSRSNAQTTVHLKLNVNGQPDLDYQFFIATTQP